MSDSFKLVLLGASGVGKSSLIMRFCKDTFTMDTQSTIGADFMTSETSLSSSQKVGWQIWDTAGQEIYESLTPMYFRGASAAICVYDITSASTFARAKKWVVQLRNEIDDSKGKVVIALCGNKCDKYDERQVSNDEAKSYAQKEGLIFLETSAKTSENVQATFLQIAKTLVARKPQVSVTPKEKGEGVIRVDPGKQPVKHEEGCGC